MRSPPRWPAGSTSTTRAASRLSAHSSSPDARPRSRSGIRRWRSHEAPLVRSEVPHRDPARARSRFRCAPDPAQGRAGADAGDRVPRRFLAGAGDALDPQRRQGEDAGAAEMIAALAWARAHWKHLSVAGAFAAAFGAGWLAHRPPPTPSVALREDTAFQRSLAESTQTTQEKAPAVTTIDETLYDPPTVALPTEQDCHPVKLIPVSMPGPVREVRHTVIETGPEVVRT